jgi:hypothetical protein
MSQVPHAADAEVDFVVINVTPDFCRVDGKVVPFEIFQTLDNERAGFARSVKARGNNKMLMVNSVIRGVQGNEGEGVISGVALKGGDVLLVEGASNIKVEGRSLARHNDLCLMNGK